MIYANGKGAARTYERKDLLHFKVPDDFLRSCTSPQTLVGATVLERAEAGMLSLEHQNSLRFNNSATLRQHGRSSVD